MTPEVLPPAEAAPVQAVIFDLDGTLVQTRVASWEIFAPISERFGLGIDRPEQYFELFQGNVFASIRARCRDDAHAAEVKEAFLERLRTDYTPPMVPGMVDVVRRLAGDCTLAVMSSNAMQVLRRVLVNNDLALCFAHVFGGDVAPDKQAAIRAFLADAGNGFGRRCSPDYDETGHRAEPDPASTVLVTDTAGDVRDALAAGIRVVGVAWGMHSVEELEAAGAEFVALWPQEVSAHLLGAAAAAPPRGACALPATPLSRGVDKAVAGDVRGSDRAGSDGGPDRPPVAAGTAAAIRRERRHRAAAALATDAPAPVPATPVRTCANGTFAPTYRARVPLAQVAEGPVPAAAVSATPGSRVTAELLDAVRRVCHRG